MFRPLGRFDPTPNQRDGGWRTFERIEIAAEGMLITWGAEGTVLRRTLTSAVVRVDAASGDDDDPDAWQR